jgi:hypothetical protein
LQSFRDSVFWKSEWHYDFLHSRNWKAVAYLLVSAVHQGCHEDIWENGGRAPPVLISTLDGVEWPASLLDLFNTRERTLATHWIGGLIGPRAGLEAVEKRKIVPTGNRSPIFQPVAIPTEFFLLPPNIHYWLESPNCTKDILMWQVSNYNFMLIMKWSF